MKANFFLTSIICSLIVLTNLVSDAGAGNVASDAGAGNVA